MTAVALLIDLQVDFFRHERLARRRAVIAANVNLLLVTLRQSRVPIVWIRQEFQPDLSDASLEVKRENISVVIAGTAGASVLPELDVHTEDISIVKKRYSAFFGTELDNILSDLCCGELIVAGINTHACVRTTVIDAYQRDYRIIMARDCIDSHDEVHDAISWNYMAGKFGRGMSNDEVAVYLGSTSRGTSPEQVQ